MRDNEDEIQNDTSRASERHFRSSSDVSRSISRTSPLESSKLISHIRYVMEHRMM
jgi:hypothetical protein